jgi:hypothetical protein
MARDGNGEFPVGERSPIPVPARKKNPHPRPCEHLRESVRPHPRPCTGKFPRRVTVPANSLQFMYNEEHIRITQG